MPDERPATSADGRRAAIEKMKSPPIADKFNSRNPNLWSELLHQEQQYREFLGYPPVVHDPDKYLGTSVPAFLDHLNTLSLYAGQAPPWVPNEMRMRTPAELQQFTPEYLATAKRQLPLMRKIELQGIGSLSPQEKQALNVVDKNRNLQLLKAMVTASGDPSPEGVYEGLEKQFSRLPTRALENAIMAHPRGLEIIPGSDTSVFRTLTPAEEHQQRTSRGDLTVVDQLLENLNPPTPGGKIKQVGTGLSMGAPSEPSAHLAHGFEYVPETPEYYERETDTGMLRFDRDWAYTPGTPEYEQHRKDISKAVSNLVSRKEDTPWDLNKLEDEWRTVRRGRLSQEAYRRQYPVEKQEEEQDSGTE